MVTGMSWIAYAESSIHAGEPVVGGLLALQRGISGRTARSP